MIFGFTWLLGIIIFIENVLRPEHEMRQKHKLFAFVGALLMFLSSIAIGMNIE